MFRRRYIAFSPAPCTCMHKYCGGVLVPQIFKPCFKYFMPSQPLSFLFLKLFPGALRNLGTRSERQDLQASPQEYQHQSPSPDPKGFTEALEVVKVWLLF